MFKDAKKKNSDRDLKFAAAVSNHYAVSNYHAISETPNTLRQSYPYTGPYRSPGIQNVEVPRISRQSAHEDGNNVVSLYPQEKCLILICVANSHTTL